MFLQYFLLLVLFSTFVKSDDEYCPEKGIKYYPHYSNCSLFFECDDGVRILMRCPGNTAWNIEKERCLDISTVDCSYTTAAPPSTTTTARPDQQCPATGIAFLPHLSDCTKYYECDDGTKTMEECPTGKAFSVTLYACDFIKNVDCSYTTPGPTSPPDDGKCPASGISYLPDYANCSSFYECRNGIKTFKTCPEGYAWDIHIDACVEEDLVDCSYTTLGPDTTSSITPTGWTPDPLCPYPSRVTDYFPDPYNCSKFFECKNGVKRSMTCPFGYNWDVKTNICLPQDEVDCSYTSTFPTTTSNPIPPPSGLCKDQKDGTKLQHPYDCTKYIQCLGGHEIVYPCASGSTWNDNKKTCDTNNVENCKDISTPITQITVVPTGTTTPGPTPSPSGTCKGQADGTLLPYPGNCTYFIMCDDQEEIIYRCKTGTSWSTINKMCDTNNSENCNWTPAPSTTKRPDVTTGPTRPPGTTKPRTTIVPPDANSCKGKPDGTLLPYPNDAHKYIECVSGIPVVFPCANDSTWDSNSKSCK